MIAIWERPNGLVMFSGANTLKLLAQPVPRRTLQHRDGIHDVAQSCLPTLRAGRTHSEQVSGLPLVNPALPMTWKTKLLRAMPVSASAPQELWCDSGVPSTELLRESRWWRFV